ncbi:MAG: CRISPR-associated helicase Cas3', partial [Acidimicrobiales bacterium]
RGLTAPITVSTCDQVLAAALSHKFLPVRLAALASKHVILDEVHTYDPYQQRLLVRLLGWLGFFRSRVTLLSATLPHQRLTECMNAYLEGWNRFDKDAIAASDKLIKNAYPAVVRTTPGGGIETIKLTAHCTYVHEITVRAINGVGDGFNLATAELTHSYWQAGEHQRIGLIVNTVDRAQQIAQLLRARDHEVLLLHSRMTADQRTMATRELMDRCGKEAGPGPVMLVSTQIAEASLDIDLDLLITDLAPMASLIQRFGRQWRHSTPCADATWRHPPHLQHRSGNPKAIVLVPQGDDGQLHPRGHYPYTRAEMNKTLKEAAALDGGSRTELRVPDDIQCAVDAANVSWDDLVGIDDESVVELTGHLAGISTATQIAKLAGVDASTLATNWRGNGFWEASDTLHQLTVRSLWNEEAVTRLRDGETVQVLVCDPDGTSLSAWRGSAESVLEVSERTQIKQILGHVIPVSGALARELRMAATPHIPAGWDENRSPLIRDLLPVPVGSLAGIAELTADGLVKMEKGNR